MKPDCGKEHRLGLSYATALAATLSSALLFIVSFQPLAYRPVAWIALVPFILALESATVGRAATLGVVWGMVAAYGITDWLPRAVATYYQQPAWLGATLFGTAAFVMGGVYYMAFAVFYATVAKRMRGAPFVAAAAWVVAEFGRARVLTGNPWGLFGYTQAGHGPGSPDGLLHSGSIEILQAAGLAGVYGVSFVLVAANVALARLILSLRRPGAARDTVIDSIAVVGVLAVVFAYGTIRLSASRDQGSARLEVAIVQANLDLGAQWDESMYGANLAAYLRLTQQALAKGRTDLVVWPENAMTFFVDKEPVYRRTIASVIAPHGAQLLAGAPRFETGDTEVYFNSAFVIAPNGGIVAHYDKEHLLPFSEYFPFGTVEYLRRAFARVREFTPGSVTEPVDTVAGRAAILICNEAMFPRIARRRFQAGGDYIVNLANDTWVGDVEFAEHQFDIAAMRAVEFGRYLVRASTSGPSGIVDPFGRVIVRTKAYEAGFARGSIGTDRHDTLYLLVGDAFAWICLAAVAAIVAVRLRKSRHDARLRGSSRFPRRYRMKGR